MSFSIYIIIYLVGWLFCIWRILPMHNEKGPRYPFYISIVWPVIIIMAFWIKIKVKFQKKEKKAVV